MISASAASHRWLLPLLLLLAGLHATSSALVHPLFQVSDEVNYFAAVQREARVKGPDGTLSSCIGVTPPHITGGRRLFHQVGAAFLVAACERGVGAAAPIALRVVLGLSLVVITWCGWEAARLITGQRVAQAVAALSLATQPVLAKYAAAITPDSLVNLSAAIAIVATLGLLIEGPSVTRVLVAALGTAAAVAFKENGLFLPAVHLLALLAWAVAGSSLSKWVRLLAVLLGLVALAAVVIAMPTSYTVGPGLDSALASPFTFAGATAADVFSRLPGFLASSYSSLGGFGGTSAALPPTAAALALGLWLAAAGGLLGGVRRAPSLHGPVLAYLGMLMMACLVQAPARQVLTGMTDQHQGRWLFPVAVPVALALATGLARLGGTRSWPLVTMTHLTIMVSALASVVQFHVTSPAWGLDRESLYLHATGGHDIGVAETAARVSNAWAATTPPGPATLALLSCLACGALLLLCRPVPGNPHVHHAENR